MGRIVMSILGGAKAIHPWVASASTTAQRLGSAVRAFMATAKQHNLLPRVGQQLGRP
jgi:hypothetical protein